MNHSEGTIQIAYTDHACRQALLRGITKSEIETAISYGTETPGWNNKSVFTSWESNICVVIARPDEETYLVVTAYRPFADNTVRAGRFVVLHA